jgi:hypothetical protein
MPTKVENELMDGKGIENWLQSMKRGTLQYSEESHQAQEAHSRWLISSLWISHR